LIGRLLLSLLLSTVASAEEEAPRFILGVVGGVSVQSDQYVGGALVGYRGVGLPFLDVELVVVAGVSADYVTLRPAVHVRPRLEVEGFRITPILGGSMYSYWPRGPFARFCDKAELPCSDTVAGFDLGLGLGYRWFGFDFVFGTGELPLYTFVGRATFLL